MCVAFLRNGGLQATPFPAVKSKALFNRYDVGMEYGLHVDSPVMGDVGDALRSDIAITVFLSDPKDYVGGELMMNMSGMEYGFKLEAGSAVAYPANTLHRVTPLLEVCVMPPSCGCKVRYVTLPSANCCGM